MRSCLSDEAINRLVEEDVPYIDLTTLGLGINERQGALEFYTRHPMTVCGTEEAADVFRRCGAVAQFSLKSGSRVASDQLILRATGSAKALHAGWRVALNLLEYASGIATRTAALVETVKRVSPATSVVTTRKIFPGTKAMMIKAIIAGGAFPHRLGLSDTILVFKQHLVYLGGFSKFMERIAEFRQKFQGRKMTVEVDSVKDAWNLAEAGVDIIQMDKVPLPELAAFVPAFKQRYPMIPRLAAAGGITRENVKEYAALGVDLLVTSSPYSGKPADIAARMIPLEA